MISIIVCTYNRERYIEKCLEHLANQTANINDYEIILVDNKSTDNTKKIAENFNKKMIPNNFHYFHENNQGLSHARNRGIKESIGDIIVFVDDDAFACKDYVTNIKYFFEQHPKAVGFGGKITPLFEKECPNWMSKWLMPLVSVLDMGERILKFKNKQFPIGANMGFRKEISNQIGVFNVELGRTGMMMLGGEEKDFFFRVKKFSKEIYYLPNAIVQHVIPEKRLTKSSIKKQAKGIGRSEWIRNNGLIGVATIYLFELVKWIVSLALSFAYLLSGSKAKAKMLIRFRLWVTLGILNK